MRSVRQWLAAVGFLALVACGGGSGGSGGGGSSGSPSPTADPPRFAVEGTLSGLGAGKTVVLQLAAGGQVQETTVTTDGGFIFAQPVTGSYEVTVRVPPAGQVCAVVNGQGEAGAAAPALSVACAADGFRVGGSVTGNLDVVVLRNTANGETLTLGGNGTFTFTQPVLAGGSYAVVVAAQSASQSCSVAGGSGTALANVAGIQVTCQAGAPPTGTLPPVPATPTSLAVSYGIKTFNFTWNASASATSYRLFEDPDGFGPQAAVQIGGALTSTSYSHAIPLLHTRLNAQYSVQACNAGGCSFTPNGVAPDLSRAIGYFKASNANGIDEFGYSVALSADGSTLAVGARYEFGGAAGIDGDQADNSASVAGAVYLFTRSAGGWSQQAYVKASNTGATDVFGYSVALSADGSTLAVGAIGEASSATVVGGDQSDDTADNSGAVYLFTRSAGTWSQQAYVKASNTDAGDNFGSSVALSADGQTLAVGAPREESAATGIDGSQGDDSVPLAGAVYVFTRPAGTWIQQAYVKASNTGPQDFFGSSVTLSADGATLAVGARGDDGGQILSGAVYVYTRLAEIWSQQAYLKASNIGDRDFFGTSVALSADGSILAVGAPEEDSNATGVNANEIDNSESNAGAAYVFTRSAGTWTQQAYVKASNARAGSHFGASVALSGDGGTLVVGASEESSGATNVGGSQADTSAVQSGAVYVFTRAAETWSQQGYIKATNTSATDFFGAGVAVSTDGSTLAVGAHQEDSNATGIGGNQANDSASSAGAVYLY